jgi:hypothetical protein
MNRRDFCKKAFGCALALALPVTALPEEQGAVECITKEDIRKLRSLIDQNGYVKPYFEMPKTAWTGQWQTGDFYCAAKKTKKYV